MSDKLATQGEVRLIASPNTWMEGSAVDQLRKTATLPGMKLAVGLPDLHPGKGSPIGAAFVAEDWIYPALVGNDIGCGIGLWRTDLNAKKPRLETWTDRLYHLDDQWDGDACKWLSARNVEPSGFESTLGTIGGGNHFAELQSVAKVENTGVCEALGVSDRNVVLCVHSGSRGFGESILRQHVDAHGGLGLRSNTAESSTYLQASQPCNELGFSQPRVNCPPHDGAT